MLPEDDANRQMATGFILELSQSILRRIQVLPKAGGWKKVLDRFRLEHLREMQIYPNRFIVLLIDFDGKKERLENMRAEIPAHLIHRVFILGVWTEPEDLKTRLGSYETIGKAMAKDCREGTNATWGHDLLRHNAGEIDRLRQQVRPFLFETT